MQSSGEAANATYARLLTSSSPTAPDERKAFLEALITPPPSQGSPPSATTNYLLSSDDVARCLAAACHDPWSAIRKIAVAASAAAYQRCTDGSDALQEVK